jgi:hypothetical protein
MRDKTISREEIYSMLEGAKSIGAGAATIALAGAAVGIVWALYPLQITHFIAALKLKQRRHYASLCVFFYTKPFYFTIFKIAIFFFLLILRSFCSC